MVNPGFIIVRNVTKNFPDSLGTFRDPPAKCRLVFSFARRLTFSVPNVQRPLSKGFLKRCLSIIYLIVTLRSASTQHLGLFFKFFTVRDVDGVLRDAHLQWIFSPSLNPLACKCVKWRSGVFNLSTSRCMFLWQTVFQLFAFAFLHLDINFPSVRIQMNVGGPLDSCRG